MYWSPRRCCANVEFLRRGDQLLWTQSRKVRKLTRVQARPDHRIKRRLAFSLEFKSAKLLAAPKRIVSLVLRSRDAAEFVEPQDRKSTRLNSSHGYISYAVFCLKKKTQCILLHPLPPTDESFQSH